MLFIILDVLSIITIKIVMLDILVADARVNFMRLLFALLFLQTLLNEYFKI